MNMQTVISNIILQLNKKIKMTSLIIIMIQLNNIYIYKYRI